MKYWRMAFRVGNQGTSLWSECEKYGVAAITYPPVVNCDFSKYSREKLPKQWNKLGANEKGSLSQIIFDMMPGDIIYVKEGKNIISKGVIEQGYFYDYDKRIIDENGLLWPHQVKVSWQKYFNPIDLLLGAEQHTILELSDERIKTVLLREEEERQIREKKENEIIDENINKELNYEYREGHKINVNSEIIVRNSELIKQKKQASNYKCEICGFSFKEQYGDIGSYYIEGHHLRSISQGERSSCLEDIALLCSNCHSMVHRKNPPYNIDELKEKMLLNSSEL
jgi:5-methylcytosine-specific restriction endonuclease McrA